MKRIRSLLQLTVFVQIASALVVTASASSSSWGTSIVKTPTSQAAPQSSSSWGTSVAPQSSSSWGV